ncbi:MAG: SsrA-binding protein SmpB [Simkaniaceae bacterium]|nr:SsrA-binding protein SmpB [Candidatus Sacchlamyda saccharinae]
MSKPNDLASNRKAFHDYQILETYEAGISLMGSEVKSLRAHQGSLQDAYVLVSDHEVILKNASIAPYTQAAMFGHEERRPRKLLLHKKEIAKLIKATQDKGIAIIPLAIYVKGSYIKVKIGVAKGKKSYDKRAAIKEREQKRDIERAMKK